MPVLLEKNSPDKTGLAFSLVGLAYGVTACL